METYTKLEEQTLKPHQYLTVIKYADAVGKIFYTDDGETLNKDTLGNATTGVGRVAHVPDVESLAALIKEVSECNRSVLVNGYYPMLINGAEFDVVTVEEFKSHFNRKIRNHKKPKKINGSSRYTVTRTAQMMEDSTWVCWDLDMSEHMPDQLNNLINVLPYHALMCQLSPALQGVDYLSVASSSSRVHLNGEAYSKQNRHIYMQMNNNVDGKRIASSLLLRSASTPLHFITPIVNAQTGIVDGTRKGTLNTIFDRSVFSKARVLFEGKPSTHPHANLKVEPQVIKPTRDAKRTIDTMEIKNPSSREQEAHNHIISRTNSGVCEVVNMVDLTLDTMIQVKHVNGGYEPEWLSMEDFINGDITRYRAQNPFKPSSNSWSALLNKVTEDGEPCTPFLFSSEYGKYIVNTASVAMRLLGGVLQFDKPAPATPRKAPPPPPATPRKAPPPPPKVNAPPPPPPKVNAPPPPPPKVNADKNSDGWLLRKPLTETLAFISDDGIDVAVPDISHDDLLKNVRDNPATFDSAIKEPRSGVFKAIRDSYDDSVLPEADQLNQVDYMVNHHFCTRSGSLNVTIKDDRYWGYTGTVWKEIKEGAIDELISKLLSKAKGKSTGSTVRDFKQSMRAMIKSRQNSVNGADEGIEDYAYDELDELPSLPTYMTPMMNCIYDWRTNSAIPHTKAYFYTKVVQCNYDPSAKSAGVLYRLITEGLSTSNAMTKAMEMFAYGLSGGDNVAQKYMCFTGAAGSGKSTLIEAMIAMSPTSVGLSVSRYGDDQLVMSASEASFVHDDDVVGKLSTAQLNEMIKKMVSPSTVSMRALYSSVAVEVRLHKKAVWAFNEMPDFGEYSEAINRRLEVVEFDISHTHGRKVNFEAMLRNPEELSGIFNEAIAFNKLHCENNGVSNYAELEAKGNVLFTQDDRTNTSLDDSFRIANPLEVITSVLIAKEGVSITNRELVVAARKLIRSLPQLEKLRGYSDLSIAKRLTPIMKHVKFRSINNIKDPVTGKLCRGYRDCYINDGAIAMILSNAC